MVFHTPRKWTRKKGTRKPFRVPKLTSSEKDKENEVKSGYD